MLLQASALSLAPLFDALSFSLSAGDRLGLVAINGAGKSSLLRCLAGQQAPTAGRLTLARGATALLVPQELPEALAGLTLAEALRRAIPPAERAHGAWRAEAMLEELEAPEALRATALGQLSGGWQRLALLARGFLADPALLLLDEPTNHLDLAKIDLLTRWATAPGAPALVVASHDRAFLDEACPRTLFLRPADSFLAPAPYARAVQLLAARAEAQAGRAARAAGEADRLRRSAAELKNVGVNRRSDTALRKSAQLGRRAAVVEASAPPPPAAPRAGTIRLAVGALHAKRLLTVEDQWVTAPDGKRLFRSGALAIGAGERLVLLGANGSGKSSFLQLLRQAIASPRPGIAASPALRPGYLDQGLAHLPPDSSAERLIAGLTSGGDAAARRLLAGAGIPVPDQQRELKKMSPGQRARLGLLALRLQAPNFFLLDEPTNHLDIPGREALEEAVLEAEAACLLVSHDRHCIARLGTRFLRIEGGKLREVDGPD
ncbi:ATP-binding cassette domain-containing protein [Roseomonas sp. USHLN139]|uniref:ATP-binding cassette domain-containing protein n=1 Tax=Roseomonas sp. USHLN139 TaxID=3081298 RepID=UPI003B01E5C8